MPAKKVTDEQIREAAYLMWKKAGGDHGSDQDYWYKAEQALKGAPAKRPAKKLAAKKPAAKKPAAKAATAKKPAATKTAPRKTTPRKTAAKAAPKSK